MKIAFTILAVAFLALFGTANAQYCTTDARYTDAAFFDTLEITVGANTCNIGIASDFQANPDTLLMDLYYPNLTVDLSPQRPFIMMFHGGGFSSGDKQAGDIRDLCIHLAMRGFVCASVNYRLGHDFSEYGQYKARYRAIQDGNAAMRFIVANANTIRIDTSWIFVGGQSAGSLVALGMVYADPQELDSVSLLYNATATSVELGNLNTSGNNLTNTYSIKGIFNNWGGVTASEVDLDEMLPTVAFHGGLDSTVFIDADNSFAHYTLNGSRAIHNELVANNICSELTVDTTGGHGIFRNASSLFRAKRASCFFKSVFCSSCTSFYTEDSIPANCSIPLDIERNQYGSDFHVYPNPVQSSLYIDGMTGTGDLTIYDGFGKLVYQNKLFDGFAQIDLKQGIYFLNLKQIETNRTFTAKLIKN